MAQKIIRVGSIEVANDKPMVLFGGMNVLESWTWPCRSAKSTCE